MKTFLVALFFAAVVLPLLGMWLTGGAPEQYPDEDLRNREPR